MLYEVHYRARPAWEVGEGTPEHVPGAHYHDDHAGKVLGVRPVGSDRPSLRHMADKDRPVIERDLTPEEVVGLRNRTLKITDRGLEAVTVNDRWGHAATILRERDRDPAAWEAYSREAAVEAERANELDEMRYAAEESVYKERMAASIMGDEPYPDPPKLPIRTEVHDSFGEEAIRIARALPAPDVHTGTGYYTTKESPNHQDDEQKYPPTGQVIQLLGGGYGTSDAYVGGYITNQDAVGGPETRAIVSHTDNIFTLEGDLSNWSHADDLDVYDAWSTIQAALDQLWTDQSTVTFTATQTIRIFAGTFDENVAPNTGLDPSLDTGYALVLEGDPADSRANVIIAASAGNYGVHFSVIEGPIITRHLTIAGAVVNTLFRWDGSGFGYLLDCVIDASVSTATGISHSFNLLALHVWDCNITISGATRWGMALNDAADVRRCRIKGPGKATSSGYGISAGSLRQVEGCTISGFRYAMKSTLFYGHPVGETLLNSTIYDCTYGWANYRTYYEWMADASIINNIFSSVDYPLMFYTIWPEENDYFGPWLTLRNNLFFNYTAFAYRLGDAATKTYAQIAAMNQVDAAGDLDATDPLLTAPATDDFSLADDSPCKRTGIGAGVLSDVNGTAYDLNNPDIGGVSSGSSRTVPVLDLVTATSGTVTATVTLGGAPYVRARLQDSEGTQEDEQTEASEGAGSISLTPTAAGWRDVLAWGVSAGDDPIGEPTRVFRIWVPPSAATVYYSIDGGTSWTLAAGDAWPVTAGEHIVRLHVRDAELSRRIMVKIESTDNDVWGVRKIVVKGNRKPQEISLE